MNKKMLTGWVVGLISLGIINTCGASTVTWSGNGHEYEVVSSQGITWSESRTGAQSKGAGWDLATITSMEEQSFIAGLLGIPPSDSEFAEYYIGGQHSSGSWGWVTNEAFNFTFWGPGEPNGNADEPFIALDSRFHTPNWGWNDFTGAGESFTAGYVAEKSIPSVPIPAPIWLFASCLVWFFGMRRNRSNASAVPA